MRILSFFKTFLTQFVKNPPSTPCLSSKGPVIIYHLGGGGGGGGGGGSEDFGGVKLDF